MIEMHIHVIDNKSTCQNQFQWVNVFANMKFTLNLMNIQRARIYLKFTKHDAKSYHEFSSISRDKRAIKSIIKAPEAHSLMGKVARKDKNHKFFCF